jgi:hypothetical protein
MQPDRLAQRVKIFSIVCGEKELRAQDIVLSSINPLIGPCGLISTKPLDADKFS